MRWRVIGKSGTCSVTNSEVFSRSSMLFALRTEDGRRQAASTVISGSKPTTLMPSLIAVSATSPPTAPRPTMPNVRCGSSIPANCFFPSSTRASRSSASVRRPSTYESAGMTLRAASSNAVNTSSFTALALAPGALNTGTPRFDISATGMLFVPAPARPIAFTLAGIVMACMSCERTRIASGCSSDFAVVYRAAGRRCNPWLEIWLSVRMPYFVMGFVGLVNSSELPLGIPYVVDEAPDALERHGVVDRRAHASHRAVTLELDHAALLRALEEGLVERRVVQLERHVHARAILALNGIEVEAGAVQVDVQKLRLVDVPRLDRVDAALPLEPFEHQPRDVNRVRRGGIHHRVRGRLLLPVEGARRDRQRPIEKVVPDDHERKPRRSGVLLGAAVDDAVFRHIDPSRKQMRRHVGDQRHRSSVRRPLIFHPADGLVGADVHVGRIARQLPGLLRGHVSKAAILRRSRDIDGAVFSRFLDGFPRPFAGIDVVRGRPSCEQVHRNDRVLRDRAALQEKDPVAGRDREQRSQVGLRLVVDLDEFLAAMAHLHHRHAAAVPVGHLGGGRGQDRLRQHRRTGAEIEHSHRGKPLVDRRRVAAHQGHYRGCTAVSTTEGTWTRPVPRRSLAKGSERWIDYPPPPNRRTQ